MFNALFCMLTACVAAHAADGRHIVPTPEPSPLQSPANATLADVTAVTVAGDTGAYTFSVTIASPDTGCDQYADWWEVVTEDGELLYRRILAHSHAGEQPFTRSGGPVKIDPETVVWVHAHLAPGGYGGIAIPALWQPGLSRTLHRPGSAQALKAHRPSPMVVHFR